MARRVEEPEGGSLKRAAHFAFGREAGGPTPRALAAQRRGVRATGLSGMVYMSAAEFAEL